VSGLTRAGRVRAPRAVARLAGPDDTSSSDFQRVRSVPRGAPVRDRDRPTRRTVPDYFSRRDGVWLHTTRVQLVFFFPSGLVWELVERRGMKGIGVEEFPL
jgi:hypothetical protein